MIETISTILRLRRQEKLCAQEARLALFEYINQNHPSLIEEYEVWFNKRRNINAAGLTSFLGSCLCNLENVPLDLRRKSRAFFAGAIGRISDDLLDDGIVTPADARILENHCIETSITSLKLLSALEEGLLVRLPLDYRNRFEGVISQYNQSQVDSLRLKEGSLRIPELVDIKDRAGGFSALFLYSIFFPDNEFPGSLHFKYEPQRTLPKSKFGALYNWGAWLSRIDDLWDEKYDSRNGIKQLVSEGVTNSEGIKTEGNYVFEGLSLFYSRERVKAVMKDFKPFTNKLLVRFY